MKTSMLQFLYMENLTETGLARICRHYAGNTEFQQDIQLRIQSE